MLKRLVYILFPIMALPIYARVFLPCIGPFRNIIAYIIIREIYNLRRLRISAAITQLPQHALLPWTDIT
jgi:hypothetical protein